MDDSDHKSLGASSYGAQIVQEDAILTLDNRENQTRVVGSEFELVTDDKVDASAITEYRLYKYRFVGALGIFMLDFLGGFNPTWFGPISNEGERNYLSK